LEQIAFTFRILSLLFISFFASAHAKESCAERLLIPLPPALDLFPARLDWPAFHEELRKFLAEHGDLFESKILLEKDGSPIYSIRSKAPPSGQKISVLITAGIHGSEALGPLTALELLQLYARNKNFRHAFDLQVLPALNPWGLQNASRYLSDGRDLNRQFTAETTDEVSLAVKEELAGRRFDLAVDLHGALTKSQAFFIYASYDEGLSEAAIRSIRVEDRLKSSSGSYPGTAPSLLFPQTYWLTAPGVSRTYSRGTFKNFARKELGIRLSYTLEYPMRRSLGTQSRLNFRLLLSLLHHARKRLSGKDEVSYIAPQRCERSSLVS
jgi:hypothetical protein